MSQTAQDAPVPADGLAALTAQYDVIRVLGRGAMATVYLAQERLLQRHVAVKVLPAAASLDDEARARFLREARTAARLTHPNIVPLYSFIEAGTSLLYVMGYIEGESLGDLLEREGRLDPAVARRILDDIADALGYAHSLGVIHRDVKPDNILIERSTGCAYLADFGVARETAGGDTLTQAGMVVGTPLYMSPEQAGGEAVDAQSDLYSLGIVGFQMLSGQMPFTGSTLRHVLTQRITSEPASLTSLVPDTPADLAIAVTRSLRREPADRWKDAAALRAALQLDAERPPVLPDALEGLPSTGSRLLGVQALVVLAGIVLHAWDGDPAWLAFGFATPLLVFPLVMGNYLRVGRREGYGWRRILTLFFWAPPGWTSWWPRRLRRPGNVWERLPRMVRAIRTGMLLPLAGMFGLLTPAAVLFLLLTLSGDDVRATALFGSTWMVVTFIASFGILYGGGAWSLTWKSKYRLSTRHAHKLLVEPVVSPFWKRPEIAHVLAGVAPGVPVVPQSPAELAAAIESALAQLPERLREQMDDAGQIAREAAAYAGRIHHELTELARELDPEERRKLEKRLEELSSQQGPGRAQLRELVQAQVRVMDELELRRASLADAHERIERGLAQIWLQLSSLRGGGLGADLEDAGITGRIRALCADLERHQLAAGEVAHLAGRTE